MYRSLCNLVYKVRRFLARGRKQDDNPVNRTAWELIPFSFEAEFLDKVNRVQFPHTAVCNCYYCRVRSLWESGAMSASSTIGDY